MYDLRSELPLDTAGRPLEVGDRVAFATGKTSLSTGEVVSFTPKMVKVKFDSVHVLRYSYDLALNDFKISKGDGK